MKKLSVMFGVAMFATGCGEIMIGGHPLVQNTDSDVSTAVARQDWATLETMCKDQTAHTEASARKSACHELLRRDANVVAHASCETKWDTMHAQTRGTANDVEVAKSFFACNLGDRIVAEVAGFVSHVDDFKSWEAAGLPVTDTATRVMSDGATGLRASQLGGLVEQLVQKRAFGSCEPIAARFANAPLPLRRVVAGYFVAAKCSNAVPILEGMLLESDPKARREACHSLGEIGGGASLGKLGIVADSDSAFEVVDLNKVYYVRDACRAAAGKIRLRGEGTRAARTTSTPHNL